MLSPIYKRLRMRKKPEFLFTDVTDLTLGASGPWLGTRTGADGTATLA